MRKPRRLYWVWARIWLFTAGSTLLSFLASAGTAGADLISGNAEWDYSLLSNKSTKQDGQESSQRTSSIVQRYRLALDANPFTNVRFSAGSLIDLDNSSSKMDGLSTSTATRTYYPYTDLWLSNRLYNAGIGYSRKIDSVSGGGSPDYSTINEEYHAVFGWKPEGFPSTNIRLTHTNQFDADRTTTDTTTDYASVGVRYVPLKGLDLRYQGTYIDLQDHRANLEATSLYNNGTASYSRSFFKQRVSLYSSYTFSRNDSETIARGSDGEIDTPVPAFAAVSNYSGPDLNSLTSPDPDQNKVNGPLANGDYSASAGINLGAVPFGGDSTKVFSMGLDFGPGNSSETNSMVVWLDRELPPAIAGSFTWRLFVRESEAEPWAAGPAITGATFQSALNGAGQIGYRFKVRYPALKARFVKLVVNTLDPSVALANPLFNNPGQINVTELQAYLALPVQQAKTNISSTSHLYSLDIKTRILESPDLTHYFSFLFGSTSDTGATRYSVINNLSLNHKLNRTFTVLGNVAMENSKYASNQGTSFAYNASLKATPLVGLESTLMYSGRTGSANGSGSTTSNSLFLHNIAQPYRGISVNLTGGVSRSNNSTSGTSDNVQLITGASVTPTKDWNINLNYSFSKTDSSGGTAPASSSSSSLGTLSTSYRPFTNLYLVASLGMRAQESYPTQITQNYGINWSPFPDGDLLLNLAYNEGLDSFTDTKSRSVSPSLSWRITPKTMLDLSCPVLFSKSGIQSSTTTIFNASLKTSF